MANNVVVAFIGAAAAASFSMPAQGQADATAARSPAAARLEDVTIVGSRVRTLQREAVDSVTIISREEIESRNAATGVDLFRQIPGLQIDQLGGPGGQSSVYIRGSDPNHVLVLIDGVRVNDPTNSRGGGFDLSNLDPNSIEHIEVMRGAASAIYGADAMGGVINIVTRKGRPGAATGEAGAGFGGLGYRSLNGRVSGGIPAATFSAGGSKLRDGRDSDGGKLDLTVYTASARLALGSQAAVDFDLRHSKRDSSSFPDDSGGIRLARRRDLEQRHANDTAYSARGTWDVADAVTLNAAVSSYQRIEDIASPGVAPGIRSEIGVPAFVSRTDFNRDNLLATVLVHLPRGSELAVGAEFQREHGIDNTLFTLFGMRIPADFDLKRNTRSGFAELKWVARENLVARASLRRDSVDGSGTNTSPSAGVRYSLPAIGGALKTNYSEGFKPPSFFGLGLPVPLGGNPNLRPEHSKGGSLGYEQSFWAGRANAGLTLFKTRYTDLVTFDNEINRIVNANSVDVRGAEVELGVQPSQALSLRLHFTRLLTHVLDSNEPLRQRPGKRAGLQILYTFDERSRLYWNTEYTAEVFDSSVPTGNLTLPTYLRTDIAYTLRVHRRLSISAAIDNVFDRRNESYVGFVSPGRRFRLNLNAVL